MISTGEFIYEAGNGVPGSMSSICDELNHFQWLHIDNSSGHYAPRREQLRRAVEILVDHGANRLSAR